MIKKTTQLLKGGEEIVSYTIDTQGLGREEVMNFCPPPVSCGNIRNGVSFSIGRGGWVISYEDFLEMTEIAREAMKRWEGRP